MEVEHCIRRDGEEIRNFLHRIKRTVDKGWPDDMEGIAPADHGAERAALGRQRSRDTSTIRQKDSDRGIYNEKHRSI